jgi:ABC-2 type transport system permease protein
MTGMSWLRVTAIARRHAFILKRKPPRWFDVLFWPIVDAVMFGSIGVYFAQEAGPDSNGVAILLSGILLFHVVFQAEVGLATGFMEETWSRNLLNLLVTPLKEVEYVAGTVLFGIVKLIMGVGVVSLVGLALYSFDISDVGLALIPVVALLIVTGWAVGLVVVGLILRVGQGAEILAWGLLAFVLPLSGAFYPVEVLPVGLEWFARMLPTTHVFYAARTVLIGDPVPWGSLAWAALGCVVLSGASVFYVTRMLSVFRARGYISRFN